jgi:hypothetical protein
MNLNGTSAILHEDVRLGVRRRWYPLARTAATAPTATIAAVGNSHEAGEAYHRADAGGWR